MLNQWPTFKKFTTLLQILALCLFYQTTLASDEDYTSWGLDLPQAEGGINLSHSLRKVSSSNASASLAATATVTATVTATATTQSLATQSASSQKTLSAASSGPEKEVIVAVVDTGIDFFHPFLKDNIFISQGNATAQNFGMDFSNKSASTTTPTDDHGHGTHVSGIIRSISPKVKILALKYFNPNGSGQENLNATIKALEYAVEANVDIINYSGGGPEPSPEELRALKSAADKGILVVAAAGNEHSNIDEKKNAYYPASYGLENIITVTAHNQNLEILPSSNWGKNSVDISAPGYQIRSSIPRERSGLMTGTSQATAFVSGVAALIKSNHPKADAKKIRKMILQGAKKIEAFKDKCIASGILDALGSLNYDN